jgi:hypothetical protein
MGASISEDIKESFADDFMQSGSKNSIKNGMLC